nr:hypothetical protein [Tanacetum cinerariifolium]
MEKQEVKNIIEQETKHRTRVTESLQNSTIIHQMSYISNTPQISLVIAITPDLPTEEPEYSLSKGDEHLSTILETELDEVIKSSVKNLVPIPSESDVTFDNENTLIDSSPKFDYLLEEFSGELSHIDPIPSGIEEVDFELKEEIHLDNDSYMEEIDLFLATDDLMPPGIENNDFDLEGDIYFLEELLSNDPLPLPDHESSNFDHHDDPSFPRPPPEPPDVEVFFDLSLIQIFDPGIFIKVQSERLLSWEEFSISFIRDPLYPLFDTLLPFSFENEDKVFKPGILSYLLVSHRDKITFDFSKNLMMITPDLELSRARGFVHHLLELQSLAYGNPISYILLI